MIAQAKPPTILVVDDEPLALLNAMDLVEELGFRAIAAPNADEAVQIMEHDDEVRVVFTDINMPGSMDGVGLARLVKGRWPPVAIMVTTGGPLSEPSQLPSGSGFLRKPYNLASIDNCLHEIFA
jgi:CheY-like chemotaxis protein